MKHILISMILLLPCSSCGVYSFTGASISPEVETVTIENFPNQADLVVPTLSQTFTEKLKDKFIRETQLTLVDRGGDLEFSGSITEYRMAPAAIQSNERAGLSRLIITVKITYNNNIEPDNSFEQSFSAFDDFDSGQNLSDVEDQLIDDITDQLVIKIFNASVNNW